MGLVPERGSPEMGRDLVTTELKNLTGLIRKLDRFQQGSDIKRVEGKFEIQF